MGGFGKSWRAGLAALLIFAAVRGCWAQRTARLATPCADAVRQAAELMIHAEYRPDGIVGYDPALEWIQEAEDACRSHGERRLYSAGKHMLSLARSLESTRLRVARDLSTAGNVDPGESWTMALDDARIQTVTARETGCQRAILASIRDRRVTVRIEACDLKAYD